MKKIFGLLVICSVLAFPVLAAGPRLAATDVHLVKKAPLSLAVGELKGKPAEVGSLGQNKGKNGGSEKAATGFLGEPVTGNKYAIVIGICDYPGTSYDICKSDGDSLNMYKTLTTLYEYSPANIRLFKDMGGTAGPLLNNVSYAKPTRAGILSAIDELRGLATSSDDEVVFFFSGHGADGIARDNDSESRDEAIVVHNDNSTGIDFIWDGELKTAFQDFATNRLVFVFDSCLAGGMNDVAAEGRVVSMGTSETNVAYVYSSENVNQGKMKDVDGDGQLDGEGVFTHYFANEGMLRGLADKYFENGNHNGQVVVEEAFDYAKEIIPSVWTRQKPTISDKFTNDLLL